MQHTKVGAGAKLDHIITDKNVTIQGDVIMFHTLEATYNAITFSPDGRAAVEKLTPPNYKVKRVMKNWYYAGVVGI
mgnify:CR=1 FL=1